jgi:eukaryotic-like serine/threonine-protein kinase
VDACGGAIPRSAIRNPQSGVEIVNQSGTDGTASPENVPAPAPDLVGTVLAGRYRILQKLGDGAMGEVYLGEHVRIGRRDAIKVLRGPLMQDAEAIARFNRGARNVASIQHPNVCTIYDYSDTDSGTPFIAMEFIAGESLKELLDREGPLPVARTARIVKQIADALSAAHTAGVVHRDLKPANVMLMRGRDGRDEVRVVDFDIAKGSQEGEESEVTRLGFVIGTPEYMSPEQLMAERLDGRSDLYSLGIMMFRMLSGAMPFQGSSPHEMVFQRLTNAPLTLDQVMPGAGFPKSVQALLDRALQRSPADRFPNAADFARELIEAVAGIPDDTAPAADGLGATAVIGAHLPPAGRRVSDEVPATRVAEAVVPGSVVAPAPAGRVGRGALVGSAAGFALVAVLGIGWFALDRGAEPGTVVQDTAADGLAAADLASLDPPDSVTLFADTRAEPQTEPAPAREREVAAVREPAPPAQPPAREPSPPSPVSVPPVSDPPVAAPPPAAGIASPVEALQRQFDRVAPGLSDRELTARRDTAARLWDERQLTTTQRARAAFVVALAWKEQGDRAECRRWIQRALDLNSTNRSYQGLLADCGGY